MDKLEKALKRLTEKEREWAREILELLCPKNVRGLDIKKLKGRDDIFRVRKGNLQILYRVKDGKIFILAIERRSEKTYKI